jgi:hypothetical protein
MATGKVQERSKPVDERTTGYSFAICNLAFPINKFLYISRRHYIFIAITLFLQGNQNGPALILHSTTWIFNS